LSFSSPLSSFPSSLVTPSLRCSLLISPCGFVSSTLDSPWSRGGDRLPSRNCGSDRLPSSDSPSSRSSRPPSSSVAERAVTSVVHAVRLNTRRALLLMVISGAARVAEPLRVMKGRAGGEASVEDPFKVSSGAASVAELVCSAPLFDSGCSEPLLLTFGGADPLLDVETLLIFGCAEPRLDNGCAEPLLDDGCAEPLLDDGCAEPLLDAACSEPGGELSPR